MMLLGLVEINRLEKYGRAQKSTAGRPLRPIQIGTHLQRRLPAETLEGCDG